MPARPRLEGLEPLDLVLLRIWELDRGTRSENDLRSSSREGLAGFFSVSPQRMSRDLRGLQSQGLLKKQEALAKGRMRRLGVFVPTLKGRKRAVVLHQSLLDTEIELDGSTRKLDEVLGELPVKVGVVGAARFIRRGRFDREGCVKAELGRIASITGRGMLPAGIGEFVGRVAEVEKIRDFLVDRRLGVLVVDGIPGIGKSSLTQHAIAGWVKGEMPFWYDFVESGTSRHLLDAIAYHLLTRDRPLLERCLASLSDERLSDAVPVLRRELGPLKSLLIFDNVQRAAGDALELFGHLLALANSNHSLKYVLVTRDGPTTTRFVRSHAPKGSSQVTVGGLEKPQAQRLWKRLQGLGKFEEAWRAVGGHPQLLTLTSSLEGEIAPMVAVAAEHLGRWLDPAERDALDAVALFRHPVQLDALDDLGLKDHVGIRRLIEKRFLAEDKGGLITVHDTLREVALGAIPSQKRARLDSAAARYWSAIGGPMGLDEAAYHLGRSGDPEVVRRFLLENGRVLTSAGYASSIARLFERLGSGHETGDQTARDIAAAEKDPELLLVRASFESARGKFVEAEELYQQVVELPDTSPWAEIRAKVERANVLQRLGRRKEALEALNGVSLPLDAPSYEEARLFHLLGSTYEALDELEKAEKCHRQCAAVPSGNAEALGLLGLGRVLWRKGEFQQAMSEFEACAEAARNSGEKETELNANIFLSVCLAMPGEDSPERMMKSIKLLEQISADARRFGLLRQLGYALTNLSDNYRWLRLYDKARGFLDEAFQIFAEIGEPQMQNQCKSNLSYLFLAAGDHLKAVEVADSVLSFSEGDFPIDYRLRQLNAMAYVYEETGAPTRAKEILHLAIDLARASHRKGHENQLVARLSDLSH